MLVKSKKRQDHVTHLQQVFDLLREYGMKLNPLKCAFGVSAGKFLGFMVTQRVIEENPLQLKAILQSPAPSTKKEIQQLTDRLAALGRFISRFTDRLKPFFTTLKGQDFPFLGKPRLVLYSILTELHCPSGHSSGQIRFVDSSSEWKISEHHDRMGLEVGAELLSERPQG